MMTPKQNNTRRTGCNDEDEDDLLYRSKHLGVVAQKRHDAPIPYNKIVESNRNKRGRPLNFV